MFDRLIETFSHIRPRFLRFLLIESYFFLALFLNVVVSRTTHFLLEVHLVFDRAILYGFNYLLNLVITPLLNGLVLVF